MGESLGEILRGIRESNGLSLVSVVGADGLLVESSQVPNIDGESLSATAASGLLMLDGLSGEIGTGPARQAMIEYDDGVVMLTPLDDDLLLVAVAQAESNLGRLRLVIRRAVPAIAQAVASL